MSTCVDQSRHVTGDNGEDRLDHEGKRDVIDLQAVGESSRRRDPVEASGIIH